MYALKITSIPNIFMIILTSTFSRKKKSGISSRLPKGASKTRDSRSVSKLRHTRGPQHGLGCGGASQAVTWIRGLHTRNHSSQLIQRLAALIADNGG